MMKVISLLLWCALVAVILMSDVEGKRKKHEKSREIQRYGYREGDAVEQGSRRRYESILSKGKQGVKSKEKKRGPGHGKNKKRRKSSEKRSRKSSELERRPIWRATPSREVRHHQTTSRPIYRWRTQTSSPLAGKFDWLQKGNHAWNLDSDESESTEEDDALTKIVDIWNSWPWDESVSSEEDDEDSWNSDSSEESTNSDEFESGSSSNSKENPKGRRNHSKSRHNHSKSRHNHSKGRHDHSKGKDKHDHSKRRHNHSKESHNHSKGSHKHSKESRTSSSSLSTESEWSSENSSEERITPNWCEKWCWKWAAHLENFNILFPEFGNFTLRRHIFKAKYLVKNYCRQLVESSGLMCNYNESSSNETVEVSTVEPTTEEIRRPLRTCESATDCEADECCAYRRVVRDTVMAFCTKHAHVGERCETTQHWSDPWLPTQTCPCQKDLDCVRQYSYSTEGLCQSRWSTTPDTVTTDPTAEETRSTFWPQPITDFPTLPTIEPANNSTMSCTDHMQCPFFQCCANMTANGVSDVIEGVCTAFSNEGEFCDQTDNLIELDITAACPCQSFLRCRRTNVDTNGAFGVCL